MFPKKLVFENNELRTNIEDGLMPMLFSTSKAFSVNKKGELRKISSPYCFVPRTGIEPALPCDNQILSHRQKCSN